MTSPLINLLQRIPFAVSRSVFNDRREEFYVDLSEAIRDKETLHTFLTSALEFSRRYKMRAHAQIYAVMLKRFQHEEGRLSHMLRTIVPESDLLTIAAIDGLSGNIERADGFLRLAQQIERSKAIKGTLLKSVMTSLVLLPVIVGFAFLNTKKIPAYERMAPDRTRWPEIGQVLGVASDILRSYGIELALLAAVLVTLFVLSFKYWIGNWRAKVDAVLPYSLYRDANSTDFLMNMAGLLRSGKQLVEALNILSVHASPWLRYHIVTILTRLNTSPDDYAHAFDTGLFSPTVHLRLVTYGRRAKNFSAAFIRLGTSGVEYVHKQTVKTGKRLTGISIALSLCLLGFFYFGDYLASEAIGKIMKADISQHSGT
jgi:type II secretory pathway component PulF